MDRKLVDEIQVNLAFFDLEISDPFVRKCRKWLEEKCKGSEKLLKTYVELAYVFNANLSFFIHNILIKMKFRGLNDQMIALNKINKNRFEVIFFYIFTIETIIVCFNIFYLKLSDRDAFLAVYNPDESGNLTENQKKYMKQLETWFE